MTEKWPSPTYVVRAEFEAPLDFVFRWCTNFTAQDAKYEGESYQRWILQRRPRQIVYEDLERAKDGWHWARHVVALQPPDGWHSVSVGSHREFDLDYRLTRLPGDRTRLVLTARRRPTALGAPNPAKSNWEKSVGRSWRQFARALERDFRRARAASSGGRVR